jgi:hypothetical protein
MGLGLGTNLHREIKNGGAHGFKLIGGDKDGFGLRN